MFKRLLAAVCLFSMSLCAYAEQNPQLITALINGCGASEGASEYLIVYSGGSSFTANSTNINIQYSSTDIASLITITDSFVAGGNSTYVSSLNAQLSGCDFLFINVIPGSTSIAAGSHILVLNDDVVDTIDFSAFCGQGLGSIYVLFSDDTSWSSSGRFANSPASDRLFRSIVNGTQTDFTYTDNWATDSDGDYVTWNDGGGAGAIYSNYPGCAPDNVNSLPVTLLSFTCRQTENHIKVEWVTASEENNSHFTIYRSSNGKEWTEIYMLAGKGNTSELSSYAISDTPPYSGRWYYRLKQTDYNGEFEFFEIISILFEGTETKTKVFPNPANSVFNVLSENPIQEVWMINSFGHIMIRKPVSTNDKVATFSIAELPSGVYHLILIDELGQRQRVKFLVGR
tara:strand:+ start:1914 stop:3110 length:1197 start_codon:yes stop_codon:yes gene_type:complete